MCQPYELIESAENAPIKAWTRGVPFDDKSKQQLKNVASLPFIHSHIAAMPDVHLGLGATIGSVIPTLEAVIPAAVGVDIGCGMLALKTSLTSQQLPDNLARLRNALERAIPHGKSTRKQRGDKGAWRNGIPTLVAAEWEKLQQRFNRICEKHPEIADSNHVTHLGTLGTGNHFVELCLDEHDGVWLMLHSGSRGVGNRIGSHFIELAKKEMQRHQIQLPDENLAYLREGSDYFDDYVEAVEWAQDYAAKNREIMMLNAISVLQQEIATPFTTSELAVNCHHNYVSREQHFGQSCYVTRKGAVRAKSGDLGIIPGSMGAKSFIVRGLGNPESFESCSHGAGRVMTRTQAKKVFSIDDHKAATSGVECRKDSGVIDETPMAYKDIDAVMSAQQDLVEIVHTLKQIVCIKG